ncbi:sulfotransferase 1 family member D1-like isoform X3 [Tubulanus polymorphus]|uniref:sulfotransferase 1 family member D1-like isoform X3 n=1 Tax=Tubulanus polymorphus TaxID=672921 RepID=UPI003DA50045
MIDKVAKLICVSVVAGGSATLLIWNKKTGSHLKGIHRYRDPSLGEMVSVNGCALPKQVYDSVGKIKAFPVRESDIFVATFPKSGTTWVQEIVYLIESDLDFQTAKSTRIDDRFPFLEFPCPGMKTIGKSASPRFIKTHLPWQLLPDEVYTKKPKIIYVARNAKDVSVSYYHFCRTLTFLNFDGDFTEFFRMFVDGTVSYGPWRDHITDYWEARNEANILYLTYEELQQDVHSVIGKIADFLGKPLNDERIKLIAFHCRFDNMKRNTAINYNWLKEMGIASKESPFMRKGITGDWKNYYSKEMFDEIEDYVDKYVPADLNRRMVVSTAAGRNDKT